MKTRKITTTVSADRNSIYHDAFLIDRWHGFSVQELHKTSSRAEKIVLEMDYEDVCVGDVFLMDDEHSLSNVIDDESVFEMKMPIGNWYLTGDRETPLGINRNQYGIVWVLA